MLVDHARTVGSHLLGRLLTLLGGPRQAVAEVLRKLDLGAHGTAQQHVERHLLRTGAGVPHRHLDAPEGAAHALGVGPRQIRFAGQTAFLGRAGLPDVHSDQSFSHPHHVSRAVAVGGLAQTGDTRVCIDLHQGFGQRPIRATAVHIRGGVRDVDRGGAHSGDLHGRGPCVLLIVMFGDIAGGCHRRLTAALFNIL